MEKHSPAASTALDLISQAEEALGIFDNPDEATALMQHSLDVQKTAEHFRSRKRVERDETSLTEEEIESHHVFTQVLARSCALAWHLGDDTLAESLYNRALALADDPMCGSQKQHDEIISLWQHLTAPWWKRLYFTLQKLFSAIGEYQIRKQARDI